MIGVAEQSLFEASALPEIFAPSGIRARDYQIEMIEGGQRGIGVRAALEKHRSTLVQAATGLGKGHAIGMVSALVPGRVMVLQHREELLIQNQKHVRHATGEHATIEKAEFSASPHSRVVVSSVQTQVATNKRSGEPRMFRFNPKDFGLLIIDEGHRALSPSYRKVIRYYMDGNPGLKLVLFTATPHRHDKQAVGQICESVAFAYPIHEAIVDGWLCPLLAHPVQVADLDLSKVRTTGGDFNAEDLAAIMEFEKILHELATPTIEISCGLPCGFLRGILDQNKDNLSLASDSLGQRLPLCRRRQTLVFCASVAHAERLSEILNRWIPGSAAFICGKTDDDDRRRLIDDFGTRQIQFMCNVDVFTEGTDVPGIEIVVMGKPTKSHSKFAQMAGRGVRPHDSIARQLGQLALPEQRRQLIAESPKPNCEILDLVGNTGKHKLVSLADLLGGDYSEKVRKVADKKAQNSAEKGLPSDILELLKLSQLELDEEETARRVAEEKEKIARQGIRGAATYDISSADLFDIYDIKRPRERYWKQPPATPKQIAALARLSNGELDLTPESISLGEAGRLLNELGKLRGRATSKQIKCLVGKNKYELHEINNLSIKQASRLIDCVKSNGWRRLGQPIGEIIHEGAIA